MLNNGYSMDSQIYEIRLIRDYKTGVSKGYGFIEFRDCLFATSAMDTIKGDDKVIGGRVVVLGDCNGKFKEEEEEVWGSGSGKEEVDSSMVIP